MDREIKRELERQKCERIDIVRKEKAWESEKHRLALDKLRKRYNNNNIKFHLFLNKIMVFPHQF